jgi:NTP pyrophosphatase (non-canonical NTP hydrolase)
MTDGDSTAATPLTLDEYQELARRTLNSALQPGERSSGWPGERLLDAAAGLSEEAGESLGLVRKHLFQQHPLDRARLAVELGDALWCIAALATSLELSLGAVAAGNIEKLKRRYPGGFTAQASRQREDGG